MIEVIEWRCAANFVENRATRALISESCAGNRPLVLSQMIVDERLSSW